MMISRPPSKLTKSRKGCGFFSSKILLDFHWTDSLEEEIISQFQISNILSEIQSSVGNKLGLHGGILEQTDTSLFCAHQLFRLYICQIRLHSSGSNTKGVMFYRFLITLLALHFTFVGLSVGRVSN